MAEAESSCSGGSASEPTTAEDALSIAEAVLPMSNSDRPSANVVGMMR